MKYNLLLLAAAAAVQASPFPQGVTAKLTPSGAAPSGCTGGYNGTFGVVVMNMTMASGSQKVSSISDGQPQATPKVTQLSDGQPQATTKPAPVSQISDGQPQATTKPAPVSQISDGQPQASTGKTTVAPVTQISDGQIQATTMTMKKTMPAVTQINDGQIQATYSKYSAVTQLSDGQPQAPTKTAAPVTQISDGQIQATTMVTKTSALVSQISDGQPQATTKGSAVSQISDGQPQATKSGAKMAVATQMVSCSGPGVLNLTLSNGVMIDSEGRTGYIAANYQFQFDKPPQAGAIYTAGWSVCGNGSLALGADNTFYQCLSGDFYNLYNKNWAPQCVPVTIDVLMLETCS